MLIVFLLLAQRRLIVRWLLRVERWRCTWWCFGWLERRVEIAANRGLCRWWRIHCCITRRDDTKWMNFWTVRLRNILNTTTIRHLQWRLILGIDYVCFSIVTIHELPLKPFDFSIIWRGFIGIVFLRIGETGLWIIALSSPFAGWWCRCRWRWRHVGLCFQ